MRSLRWLPMVLEGLGIRACSWNRRFQSLTFFWGSTGNIARYTVSLEENEWLRIRVPLDIPIPTHVPAIDLQYLLQDFNASGPQCKALLDRGLVVMTEVPVSGSEVLDLAKIAPLIHSLVYRTQDLRLRVQTLATLGSYPHEERVHLGGYSLHSLILMTSWSLPGHCSTRGWHHEVGEG